MRLMVLKSCNSPLYGSHIQELFHSWLREESQKLSIETHDVLDDGVPTAETVLQYDGVLIPGSVRSVAQIEPWMEDMSALIRVLIQKKKPLIGVCFGHQLIAHAVGGSVTKSSNARQIGTCMFPMHDDAKRLIQNGCPDNEVLIPQVVRLRYTHQDIVEKLPRKFEEHEIVTMGATETCPCHGFFIGTPPFVMTLQAHPEFDTDTGKKVLAGSLLHNKAKLSPEVYDTELQNLGLNDTHNHIFKSMLFNILSAGT